MISKSDLHCSAPRRLLGFPTRTRLRLERTKMNIIVQLIIIVISSNNDDCSDNYSDIANHN